MLNDLIYYSRREKAERALAEQSSDVRVKRVHNMLADKYAYLAKHELEVLPLDYDSQTEGPQVNPRPYR